MSVRLAAFVIWALVAASAAYWGLKLFVAAPPAPPHATTVAGAALRGDLSRVFGAPPADQGPAAVAAPPEAARFALIGVAAPRAGTRGPGVALIAIDGKPARPYRIGALVDGDWHLQTISARGVSLGPSGGASALALELPALPPPATGTLPPAGSIAPPPALPAAPLAPRVVPLPQQQRQPINVVPPPQPIMVPPPPGVEPTLPTS